MRVNVYAEELTNDCGIVTTKNEKGQTFFGVRFFLESSKELHHTLTDDDRSAVTLWVPWTMHSGYDFEGVMNLLRRMLNALDRAERNVKGGDMGHGQAMTTGNPEAVHG